MKKKLLSILTLLLCLTTGAWAENYTWTFDAYCTTNNIAAGGNGAISKSATTVVSTSNSNDLSYVTGNNSESKIYKLASAAGPTGDVNYTSYLYMGGSGSSAPGSGNLRYFTTGAISGNGTLTIVYAGSASGTCYIYDSTSETKTGNALTTITPSVNTAVTSSIINCGDGKNLVICHDKKCYIYAIKWTEFSGTAYTVTVAANNSDYGSVKSGAISLYEGETTVITATPASGYKVANWAVSGTGSTISPSGESNSLTTTLTMGTANATVTCTFAAATTYTISYDKGSAEGVTGSKADETKTEDMAFTLPSDAVFSRTGYIQSGWNTNADGISGDHYALGGSYTQNANQTFYPEWMALDYTFAPTGDNGVAIADGEEILTSTGGKMVAAWAGTKTRMSYGEHGSDKLLLFGYENSGSGAGGVTVTLYKKMQAGTIITGTLWWNAVKEDRSLTLHNSEGAKKDEWNFNCTEANTSKTFSYTVVEGDGLAGSNVFRLLRGNSVYLKSLTVANCAEGAGGTITPAGWASFSSNIPLDLSTISGGTAYYASNAAGNSVTLKETTVAVSANEGLMIKGTAGDVFTIDVAANGTAIEGNLLKASNGSEVAASTDGAYHYVFGYDKTYASLYGFYNLTQATTVPAGKAYLETSTALTGGEGARALIIIDDENTTGISATQTNNETLNNEYFDLQGRRVAQPTKGMYIVNGKKVIMK